MMRYSLKEVALLRHVLHVHLHTVLFDQCRRSRIRNGFSRRHYFYRIRSASQFTFAVLNASTGLWMETLWRSSFCPKQNGTPKTACLMSRQSRLGKFLNAWAEFFSAMLFICFIDNGLVCSILGKLQYFLSREPHPVAVGVRSIAAASVSTQLVSSLLEWLPGTCLG